MSAENIGKWNYKPGLARAFGDDESYRRAACWLDGLRVEDWGCGAAYAMRFFPVGSYRGIDGSPGCCDIVADLATYESKPDGLLMRHVLEHCEDWEVILKNALNSFQKRMVLITFLPLTATPREFPTDATAHGKRNTSLPLHRLLSLLRPNLIAHQTCQPNQNIFMLAKP